MATDPSTRSKKHYLAIALIAVVVIAVVLVLFLLQSKPVSQSCVFQSGFVCVNETLASDGQLLLNIRNIGQYPVNLTAIGCNTKPSAAYALQLNSSVLVTAGSNQTIRLACYDGSTHYTGPVGAVFSGYLFVNYNYTNTNNANKTQGTLVKAVSVQHLPAPLNYSQFTTVVTTTATTTILTSITISKNATVTTTIPPQVRSGITVGNWTNSTAIYPANISFTSCVNFGSNVYCVGGYAEDTSSVHSTYYAPLSSSGVGDWTQSVPYPIPISDESCVVQGSQIYCMGGSTNMSNYVQDMNFTTESYYASLSASGVGAWHSTTPYPAGIWEHTCVAYNSYVYCIGGENMSGYSQNNGTYAAQNASYYAQLAYGGIGQWHQTTPYPERITGQGCVVSGGYVYCAGGMTASGNSTADAYYAPLSSTGIGHWLPTTPLPSNITAWGSSVAYGNNMYYIDGTDTYSTSNTTYMAPLSRQGIGAWQQMTNTTVEVYAPSCLVHGNYTYCIAGEGDFGAYNTTYYAKFINAS